MRESLKRRGKELGLALLNFALVLCLLFGTQALIRGRVRETGGQVILSAVVFAAYLAGRRWIEGGQPPELVRKVASPNSLKGSGSGSLYSRLSWGCCGSLVPIIHQDTGRSLV